MVRGGGDAIRERTTSAFSYPFPALPPSLTVRKILDTYLLFVLKCEIQYITTDGRPYEDITCENTLRT